MAGGDIRQKPTVCVVGGRFWILTFDMTRKEYLRNHHRVWVANRRKEWFVGKFCAACHSITNLELDHIDPSTKISHNVWSWTKKRRDDELAKCQVLCRKCHLQKTISENRRRCGELVGTAKLRNMDAQRIRTLYARNKISARDLAKMYGSHRTNIHRIIKYKSYRAVEEPGRPRRFHKPEIVSSNLTVRYATLSE